MADSNTLAGTPSSAPEAGGNPPSPPGTECDLNGDGTPSSTPETPSQRKEDPPVGMELPPLEEDADEGAASPALSQAFRVSLVNSLRNISSTLDAIGDLRDGDLISGGMAQHLEREALKYTASSICDMVVNEIKENKDDN